MMVDVLFRMAFLLLYGAAWLIVMGSLIAVRVLVSLLRFVWATASPIVARLRAERRLRHASIQERAALLARVAAPQ